MIPDYNKLIIESRCGLCGSGLYVPVGCGGPVLHTCSCLWNSGPNNSFNSDYKTIGITDEDKQRNHQLRLKEDFSYKWTANQLGLLI